MGEINYTSVDPSAFLDLNDLPSFVDLYTGPAQNYWAVSATGNRKSDAALGRALATEAIEHARRLGSHACIGFALSGIAERGQVGDVEAGFIVKIAEAAAAGSRN